MSKKLMMNNCNSIEIPIYLVDGTTFNSIINQLKTRTTETITSIVFTKEKIPSEKIVEGIDVSENTSEYKAYGYVEGNTIYVSPEFGNGILYANSDCYKMFDNQPYITEINFYNFNTSNTTNMGWMFAQCPKLTKLDVSCFNTESANDMNAMFYNCTSLATLDLSSFSTSNVITTNSMFLNCTNLIELNINSFDVSNVTNLGSMFNNCSKLSNLDLNHFRTTNAVQMNSVFYNCALLTNLDISNFDLLKVTNLLAMFEGCGVLNSEIVINTTNITNYNRMLLRTSTSSNSKFIVKYIDDATKAMAEKLVATKSSNSNVFLWEGDDI